jgi:hypothetical protein
VLPRPLVALLLVLVSELDLLALVAVEHDLADLFGQLVPGLLHVEFVVLREPLDHGEVERIVVVPTADRAVRE